MNLEQHYHQMWTYASHQFELGRFEYDELIDSPNDSRRGITLLARPPESMKIAIKSMLNDLQDTEPWQYYYPTTDIHLTGLSIISCYEGFTLNHININDYVDLVREVLHTYTSFKISFRGLTASPSCLIVQGFLMDDELTNIRNGLRDKFQTSNLQHSIDKRYSIQTAHSTIVRFKKPLLNPDSFLQKVKKYRNLDFGTFEVNELELVFNDWYQRASTTVVLERFSLG
jgi:2'-5' RNA ligase